MTEMRDILNLLDEDMQVEDTFDLELSEDFVIETGVIGLTEDAVIIEADDETISLLEESGITLDEGDVIQGPWGDTPPPTAAPVPAKPKAPVIPISQPAQAPAKFRIQDLYREFKNSPQVRQKMKAVLQGSLPLDQKDDEVMNMAAQYLEAKLGKVHPKLLGKYALAFLDMHKAENSAQEMRETDGLDEIARLAGVQMVGGKTPAEIERLANVPTVQRIATGETPPVDRTDYNVPLGQRTSTAGMTGPEIRRQSLIKQGIIKAEGEEDIEESGLQAYLGKKKYGEKAGRDGASDRIKKFEKRVDENIMETGSANYQTNLFQLKKRVPQLAKYIDQADNYIQQLDHQGLANLLSHIAAFSDQPNFYKEGDPFEHAERLARNASYIADIDFTDPKVKAVFNAIQRILSYLYQIHDQNQDNQQGLKEAPGAETLKHNQDTEKSNLKAFDLEEGFSPSQEVADQIIDSLGGESELSSDDIYRAVEEYQGMMDSPHKLDVDEVVQIVMDRMNVSDEVDEAKYQGREVPLGKPMAGDVKKSKVYVRKPDGKVVKVNFGDKNMKIKKSNPKRRKSFRARHNCKNPGPRWKARYWSCRAW